MSAGSGQLGFPCNRVNDLVEGLGVRQPERDGIGGRTPDRKCTSGGSEVLCISGH